MATIEAHHSCTAVITLGPDSSKQKEVGRKTDLNQAAEGHPEAGAGSSNLPGGTSTGNYRFGALAGSSADSASARSTYSRARGGCALHVGGSEIQPPIGRSAGPYVPVPLMNAPRFANIALTSTP